MVQAHLPITFLTTPDLPSAFRHGVADANAPVAERMASGDGRAMDETAWATTFRDELLYKDAYAAANRAWRESRLPHAAHAIESEKIDPSFASNVAALTRRWQIYHAVALEKFESHFLRGGEILCRADAIFEIEKYFNADSWANASVTRDEFFAKLTEREVRHLLSAAILTRFYDDEKIEFDENADINDFFARKYCCKTVAPLSLHLLQSIGVMGFQPFLVHEHVTLELSLASEQRVFFNVGGDHDFLPPGFFSSNASHLFHPTPGTVLAAVLMNSAERNGMSPEQSIRMQLAGLVLAPDYLDLLNNYANSLRCQKQDESGLAVLARVVSANPGNRTYLHNFLYACRDAKAFEAAKTHLNELRQNKILAEAVYFNNYGSVLFWEGDVKHAIACFRKAVELTPDCELARENLASALKQLGYLGRALLALNQYWRVLSTIVRRQKR